MFLSQLINGVVLGSVYALLSLGLTMIFGVVRIIMANKLVPEKRVNTLGYLVKAFAGSGIMVKNNSVDVTVDRAIFTAMAAAAAGTELAALVERMVRAALDRVE